MGGSAGINIAGAAAMARELGPGHTIVTILCDVGDRYQSKLVQPRISVEAQTALPGVDGQLTLNSNALDHSSRINPKGWLRPEMPVLATGMNP